MSLSEIREHYERIRFEESKALQARLEYAAKLHPEFKALREEKHQAALNVAKAIRQGSSAKSAAEGAKLELTLLLEKERALLAKMGMPLDYLTLKAHCTICGDTGFTGDTLRVACICQKKLKLARAASTSKINANETFSCFNSDIFRNKAQLRQMQSAKRIAEEYADTLPNTSAKNLILIGMAGLGKSFLINCIAERVLSRGIDIKKITAYNLSEQLLEGIRRGADTAREFLNVPLLLIDDLGTEPLINNITLEYLFSILNERRNSLLHTVVATNLSVEKLQERYGERIFSRLVSADYSLILHFKGENLRLLPRREEAT